LWPLKGRSETTTASSASYSLMSWTTSCLRLTHFPPPDIQAAALFYLPGGKNDRRFFNKITPSPPRGKRYSRLIPIPTEWGPYFLIQPKFGATFRRLIKLMHGEDRKDLLRHCAAGIIYACGSPDPKARRPVSTMS
jgi:hypothetical protein